MRKLSITLSLCFIAFAIFFFVLTFFIGSNEIITEFISSAFIPRIVSVLLLLCAVFLLIASLRDRSEEAAKELFLFTHNTKMVPVVMGIFFVYIMLLRWFGFVPATIVFMFVMIFLFDAKRDLKTVLINVCTSIALPVAVYLLFYEVLRIVLPTGTLL